MAEDPQQAAPVTPTVAVVNASNTMGNDDASKIVNALQIQVDRDFAAWYQQTARLLFVPYGDAAPAGAWQLALLDSSDVAGALGYHDVTPEGLPIGKAFVGTDLQYGYAPSVTISHELLEMLADPAINQTVFIQASDRRGRLYAYEVCDAVEADAIGYRIDDVLVSDFVTPAWFRPYPHDGPFSFRANVTEPFQLARGGYIGAYDVWGRGWRQVTADEDVDAHARPIATYRRLPPLGSRRERRARWWHGGAIIRSTA